MKSIRLLRLQPNPLVRLLAKLLRPVITESLFQGVLTDHSKIISAREIARGDRAPRHLVVRRFPELQRQFGDVPPLDWEIPLLNE